MSKVLIVGKIPPPIGGVTMHVYRLIEGLNANDFQHFDFCDLANDHLSNIAQKIIKHRVIHLHISEPFFQLLFALFCVTFRKKLLLTYHGNWGRYGKWGNWAANWSARLSSVPIVQNTESFDKAKHYNKNALLISTFIPSTSTKPLNQLDLKRITDFRRRFKFVFCTNAWSLVFDKNGAEIYGITQIISNIRSVQSGGLIISDPSGNYKPYINKIFGRAFDNVLIIEGQHDFENVLRVSDAFIRNTTTDGVSLSIYEAHEKNVVVLASDCVSRAHFCNIYHDISKIDLINELEKGKIRLQNEVKTAGIGTTSQLISVYKQII